MCCSGRVHVPHRGQENQHLAFLISAYTNPFTTPTSPAIVHRDLSSRNVLYDGRTAKLADLGQAKAMGVASSAMGSRQTAMPGAMVGWSGERTAAHLDKFA